MQQQKTRILVVDDNEAGRYALVHCLRAAGHEVLQATTGEQALRLATEQRPELILLDIKLPDLSGIEVCQKLKNDPQTAHIPVLQLSAHFTASHNRTEGLESGADAYLTAPFEPRELLAQVSALLRIRQAERALRESEERMRQQFAELDAIYSSAPVGICVFDHNLRYRRINSRLAEINGLPPEAHIGKTVREVLPNIADQADAAMQQVMDTGRPVLIEFRGHTPAEPGVERVWEEHWFPLRGAGGKTEAVGAIVAEITGRRRTEEALARVQEELRRHADNLEKAVAERTAKLTEMVNELRHLSYAITHDMRAPLRAMGGFASVLMEQRNLPAEQADDYCRRIYQSAMRMDQLITDALSYTKVILAEVKLQPVNLGALLRGMLETYPNLQPDKADLQVEGELPTVIGNEALLTQCFSNLLGNAVKFVAPGTRPQITIRTSLTPGFARISIQDNGIGIAPDYQERIFRMFHTLNASIEGTGIGLAIVRKVVQRMHGTVGLESAPGKGSCFWVELPTVAPA